MSGRLENKVAVITGGARESKALSVASLQKELSA